MNNPMFKLVFFSGALALLLARLGTRFNKSFGRGKWWRPLITLVAVLAVLIIVMNPEFLGLGLLGDTAFFDLLILAISLQLETILEHVFRFGVWIYSKVRWWFLVKSVGVISILLSIDALRETVSRFQKFIARHHGLFA